MKQRYKIIFSHIAAILALSFLSSCQHYLPGSGDLEECYSTINVPYAEGDLEGLLTSAVIKKLSSSSRLKYVTNCGDLTLKIKVLGLNDENIGFRYDRKKGGHLKHFLIPTETRVKIEAEVTLLDQAGNKVRGPIVLRASSDFDHTFYTSRHQENVFSLGQLNDIDAARDAVMQPLNCTLADKIVDYIINSW